MLKITWYETSDAYWLLADDGRTACCGDGVDMFFDDNGDSLSPGTEAFDIAMDVFCLEPETADAYFGDSDNA